jgi:tetratricopeptide (TPR) repeat protein
MPQPAVLHVIGGNDRGKMYELVLPETRIGRGADQDLVLADIAVSRRHITIHAEGMRYRMRDLGSGNGTLINGTRTDTVILNDGDQIELGNTLMRFDHALSRQPGSAFSSGVRGPLPSLGLPPPSYGGGSPSYSAAPAPPTAAPAPSYLGPASQPAAYAPPDAMVPQPDTPSAAIVRPAPSQSSSPSGWLRLPPMLAPLAAPQPRLIVFGIMGFLSLLALIIIVGKSAFAKPVVVQSDAEELYRQGLKLFAARDYEGAKVSFGDALSSAPESNEIKRYIASCDVEVHARGAMQSAERAATGGRFAEAVKSLDAVDSESLLHDEAAKRRKELAPKAAAEDVEEARRLAQEDPDTARARLTQALALDPGNPEARGLAPRLRVELPPLPAGASTAPAPAPPPPLEQPKVKEAPPPPPPPRTVATKKRPLREDAAPPARGEPPASAAAQAAYKARDFAGAEKAYRAEARGQAGKKGEATTAFANQVRDLKVAVDKASADEAKSPLAAIKDYEDAIALDARVGRGMHAAYFRQRMGKLQLPLAQQAFQQGKYDLAFAAVQQAQRAGAGDGGLLKQLEAKAKELTDKGVSLQKSNVGQAKGYWRQVIKMVPPSSPTYVRAYQLINASGGGHKDEDED